MPDSSPPSLHAIVLTPDLMLRSQVSGAATRVGATVAVVSSAEQLLQRVAETLQQDSPSQPYLVVLDLSTDRIDVAELVTRLREALPAQSRLLAFGPHVHKQRLAAAAEAGCDAVLSRGEFHAHMDKIFGSIVAQ